MNESMASADEMEKSPVPKTGVSFARRHRAFNSLTLRQS